VAEQDFDRLDRIYGRERPPGATRLEEYAGRYEHAQFERRHDGLLRVTLHSDGGPLQYDRGVHLEWGTLWTDIARDPETRLMILTGAGDAFIPARTELPGGRDRAKLYSPARYHSIWWESVAHLTELLSIPFPVIAAVNGPARVHCEVALVSNLVLATPEAEFQDQPHMPSQLIPGDGLHVVMPHLIGPTRASSFLFLGERIGAEEAKAIGLVNEIVEHERLLGRAEELATELLRQPDHNLRYLRMLLTHELKAKTHAMLGYGAALQGLGALSTDWSDWPAPPA
jgi:enoyl-CoA hydratase/carnithine racemase